jgi:hypothetical protein
MVAAFAFGAEVESHMLDRQRLAGQRHLERSFRFVVDRRQRNGERLRPRA